MPGGKPECTIPGHNEPVCVRPSGAPFTGGAKISTRHQFVAKRTAPENFRGFNSPHNAVLAAGRQAIEKIHNPCFQRILGAHDEEPILGDQLLEDRRAMA